MKQYLLFAWNRDDKRHGWENFIKDFEAEEQEEALKTAKKFECYQVLNSYTWKIEEEITYIDLLKKEVDKLAKESQDYLDKLNLKHTELQRICPHKNYSEASYDFADFSSSHERVCDFCGLREIDKFIKLKDKA